MEMDLDALRSIEAQCISRFQSKVRELRGQYPNLSPQILRAKSFELLPKTVEKYLAACSRLTYAGQKLVEWR
jgi:hypothetical protein